jgi:hypothetical protein
MMYAEPLVQFGHTGNELIDTLLQDNASFFRDLNPIEYHKIPQPITLFMAELNETCLLVPRYMKSEPGIIALAFNPPYYDVTIIAVVIRSIGGTYCGAGRKLEKMRNDIIFVMHRIRQPVDQSPDRNHLSDRCILISV